MSADQAMSEVAQPAQRDPLIRAAGGFAIVSGIISAVGVVFLIALYVLLLATPFQALGLTFGMLNDICVAIQYLLTIPIAVALHRILLPHHPRRVRVATLIGISMMPAVGRRAGGSHRRNPWAEVMLQLQLGPEDPLATRSEPRA